MADYERLIARMTALRQEGHSFATIAKQLNAKGFRPPKRTARFHSDLVSQSMRSVVKQSPPPKAKAPTGLLKEHDWICVLHQLPGYRGPIICWADAAELDRLRRLRVTKHGWWDPPLPAELTTRKSLMTPARSSGV